MIIKFFAETDNIPRYDIFVGKMFIKTIFSKGEVEETLVLENNNLHQEIRLLPSKKNVSPINMLLNLFKFVLSCFLVLFYWIMTMFDNNRKKLSFLDMICLFPEVSFYLADQKSNLVSIRFTEKRKNNTAFCIPFVEPKSAIKKDVTYNTWFNRKRVIKYFLFFLCFMGIAFVPFFVVLILLCVGSIQDNNCGYFIFLLVILALLVFVFHVLIRKDIKAFKSIYKQTKRHR